MSSLSLLTSDIIWAIDSKAATRPILNINPNWIEAYYLVESKIFFENLIIVLERMLLHRT